MNGVAATMTVVNSYLKASSLTCLTFCMLWFSCDRGTKNERITNDMNIPANGRELYTLDVRNNSVTQLIGRDVSDPQNARFVETEVVSVVNPKMHECRFEVHYETDQREKTFLGTFSLFPSDNPGKFIVPTQGKLKAGGNLILTLVIPDTVREGDTFQVAVRKLRIRNE